MVWLEPFWLKGQDTPRLVHVIFVVLHLKTHDRWQMGLGILRLLVSARSWVLGTALPVASVVENKFCMARSVQVLRAEQAASGSKSGGVVDSLSKCDAVVWEAANSALAASRQSEIEEKRRVVVEQPTAHSARTQNSSSKMLLPYPSSRARARGSTRQLSTRAFCWRKRVTKSRNRKRE